MKFSKFSVVSVLSNWLYSSERKLGFTLVALYLPLCHTCYSYISVKFSGKDLPGQYISDFYHRSENT